MKTKILGVLLAVVMIICIMPAAVVVADAAPTHTHYNCGVANCTADHNGTADGNGHSEVSEWIKLTKADVTEGTLTLGPGNYYLGEDITIANSITIKGSGDYNLCLNGKTLKGDISNGGSVIQTADAFAYTLNICDCSNPSTGKITGADASAGGGVIVKGGTFNLYGGSITDNEASSGGGVYVSGGTTFNMYGGSITGNTVNNMGGGVYVAGTFNMYGGIISGNNATNKNVQTQGGGVCAESGIFHMYGGTISGNTAHSGGGVKLRCSTFHMYGGTISNNTATYGGGVDFLSNAYAVSTFYMYGGSITGNKATYSGGVGVDDGTFNMSDGSITDNIGGGVGVHRDGTFKVSGAPVVTGNTGGNVYLENNKVVTLSGELTTDAQIGISMSSATGGKFTSGWSTYMGDATNYTDYFTSDDNKYTIAKNDSGELILKDKTIDVTGVTLDPTSLNLAVGTTSHLTAIVAPADATNQNVTWVSSDTSVATVSDSGLVTAVAPGTATITVTTEDGEKTAVCTVTVQSNTYTVIFNANGGTGSMANQTITVGVATALNENTFTKIDYIFKGWATTANGAVVYTDQQAVTNLAAADETITLYAVWEREYKEYIILSDDLTHVRSVLAGVADVIKDMDANVVIITLTSDVKGCIHFANDNTGTFILDLNHKSITPKNYFGEAILANNKFGGKVTITGSGTINKGQNNLIYAPYSENTEAVFFAVLKVNGYYTLKADGKNFFGVEKVTQTKNYRDKVNSASYTADQLVLTQGVLSNVTISFNANEGTGTMSDLTIKEIVGSTALTANAFTRSGYIFAGWNTQADGTGTDYADGATISNLTDSITLYAQWTAKATYSIDTTPQSYMYDNSAKEFVVKDTNGTELSGFTVKYYVTIQTSSCLLSTWAETARTDAGSYDVKITRDETDTHAAFEVEIEDGLVINKKTIAEPTVKNADSYIYTGETLTVELEGVLDEYMTVDSGDTGVNAGDYEAILTLKDAVNYAWANGADGKVEWTIQKAQTVITLNPADTEITVTYGDSLTLPTAESNFGEVVCNKTISDLVNAGEYEVLYTVAADDNYSGAEVSVKVTIDKKEVGVPTVKNPDSYIYTGDKLTVELDGFASDCMTIAANTDKGTDAGDYAVVISLDSNYKWSDHTEGDITLSWTIGKAEPTVTWPTVGTVYVNDENVVLTGGSAVGKKAEEVVGTFTHEKIVTTAAGGTTIKVTFTSGDANYNSVEKTDYTVTVIKRTVASVADQTAIDNMTCGTAQEDLGLPAVVTIKTEDDKIFDNVPVTWSGYNPNTTEKQTLTGTLDLTDISDEVQQATAEVTASIEVTLKQKIAVEFDYADKTVVYSGAPVANEIGELEGVASIIYSYVGVDGTNYAASSHAPVNAGKYEVTATFLVKDGYADVAPKTAVLTILPKEVSLTWSTFTQADLIYSGTDKIMTVTVNGVVAGDICTAEVTPVGDHKNVGTFSYCVTALSNANYKLPAITNSPVYRITPKMLTVKANNQYVKVGSNVPALTYTVYGLIGNDKLIAAPVLTVHANMYCSGVYTIAVYGASAGNNYTITYVNGMLVVESEPYKPTVKPEYPLNVNGGEHGDVFVSSDKNKSGDIVTIRPNPDPGYEVDEVIVTDRNGNPVPVTDNGDGTYSFEQPFGKVKVTVTFVKKACSGDKTCPMYKYVDLLPNAWYHDGVHYCIENGLMGSTSADELIFDPDVATTRAMIVTILWRLEGSPMVDYALSFDDVGTDWYTEAVRWAQANSIVKGYSDAEFGPMDAITHEQMVTILWRYAKYKGMDVSVDKDTDVLLPFADASSVSEWALPAMQWACTYDIVEGMVDNDEKKLDPSIDVIRAYAATLLHNYCKAMTDAE